MKNKKNKKRVIAFTLSCVMIMMVLVSCSNYEGYEELGKANGIIDTNSTDAITSSDMDSKSDKDSSAEIAAIQEQVDSLTQTFNDTVKEFENQISNLKNENASLKAEAEESAKALEDANATVAEIEAENASLEAENTVIKAEKVELEAIAEKLKEEISAVHPITVLNGVIWVHIDDFLYAANGVGALVSAQDGTGYAIRTLKGVHVKVYDDEHGDEHLVPNFDLPMYDYYTIVLTADEGKTAFTGSFGNYNWANRGLMTNFTSCKFAKELTSMPKNGGAGKQFYDLIKATAVVVEQNGSYIFGVDADNYGANPVIEPAKPQVEYIDREVIKEVEKIVEVKTCMICGKTDCTGHVEIKTETVYQTVPGAPIYVEVPGETVYVPGETVYLPGETVYLPGETIYIDREVKVEVCPICNAENCEGHCGKCGELISKCICEPEVKEVIKEVEKVVEVEKEVKVEYCGRCGNLMENCTCSDSDHNDLEDIPNPNNKDTSSDHNDQDTSSDHNDLNSSGSSSTKKSSHSPLD